MPERLSLADLGLLLIYFRYTSLFSDPLCMAVMAADAGVALAGVCIGGGDHVPRSLIFGGHGGRGVSV